MNSIVEKIMVGNLPAYRIEAEGGTAVITPNGGHILSFQPDNTEDDVLWMSRKSNLEPGKAIRGGIPVCWPWFGKIKMPQHGIARISMWDMAEPVFEANGSVSLLLTLDAPEQGLSAELKLNVGSSMLVRLTTKNVSGEDVPLTNALHTYFTVGDISKVSIRGFENADYLDTLDKEMKHQKGAISFTAETDRIYYPGSRIAVIDDPVLERKICVERYGSESAVVWNPWTEKAKAMADFGDDEYRTMLCIEAANAGNDACILKPGESHTVGTRLYVI